MERQSDGELLRSTSAEAFGLFYRRHLPWVLAWLMRKVQGRELAADLAGEVFASALCARRRFDPARGDAEAWLETIARNVFIDSVRRNRVEDRARRTLGIAALPLAEDDGSR